MSSPVTELPPKKKHAPYVPETMDMKEFTLRAVLIGVAESLSGTYIGSGWKDLCVYVIFLLVLLLKPSGLLGKSRM